MGSSIVTAPAPSLADLWAGLVSCALLGTEPVWSTSDHDPPAKVGAAATVTGQRSSQGTPARRLPISSHAPANDVVTGSS